ncbi:hypothetical protein AGOR_G00191330 [Albula goreensis]|uniref:Ameloblastin n=1 Tax=Albula goreensis TaxID=1534307 RepID=A0A8T3CV26_9TELE|nr:hypothetical protein AGOR_G00191330 [Albula goreensis]
MKPMFLAASSRTVWLSLGKLNKDTVLQGLLIFPIIRMRVTIIFTCFLATVYGGPLHRPATKYILHQAHHRQQQLQPEAIPSPEAARELERVRQILEQYTQMFPPVVQPQNPVPNTPQLVLPSGTPLETPPHDPPTAAGSTHLVPFTPDQQVVPEAVSAQPGLVGDLPVQPMTQAPELAAETISPALPNEQGPQAGAPELLPVQPNTWAPQPGGPFLVPLPPNTQGAQPTDQPAQIPQVFSPYGFLPVFPSQSGTQQFPGFGLPVFFPAGYPQLPAQPTETAQNAQPSLPVQPVQPAQPTQTGQQQVPQIFYMIRQPMAGPFGSASSEELQAAGPMGGLGMFLPGFGGGISNTGVNPIIPGGLPAGQGADPAQPVVPPTSPVLPAGQETPLPTDTAAGVMAAEPTNQSNPSAPNPATQSSNAHPAPPTSSRSSTRPDATSNTGSTITGAETDLYP